MDDAHAVGGDDPLEHGQEVAVERDGGDLRPRLDERERQRPQPRADLHDPVPRPDTGQPGDAPDGVGVGDEVLAEGAAGRQAELVEQLADLPAAEGHTGRLRAGRAQPARR